MSELFENKTGKFFSEYLKNASSIVLEAFF